MVICEVLLVITSLLLILSILLHKGKGGGISDMFGGGISTAMRSSGVAERNLNRITVGVALVWFVVVVALGLMVKIQATPKPAPANPAVVQTAPATDPLEVQVPEGQVPEGTVVDGGQPSEGQVSENQAPAGQ